MTILPVNDNNNHFSCLCVSICVYLSHRTYTLTLTHTHTNTHIHTHNTEVYIRYEAFLATLKLSILYAIKVAFAGIFLWFLKKTPRLFVLVIFQIRLITTIVNTAMGFSAVSVCVACVCVCVCACVRGVCMCACMCVRILWH